MNFDYHLLGNKLKEARENQQYEISEVAEYIDKSAIDYHKIETGDYITLEGDTLVLLAKLFKIDFRYLVTGNYPSAESQITKLFRQNSELSKRDRRAIQAFIRLCETKNDIEKMLNVIKHPPKKYTNSDFKTNIHKNQGIVAAANERERLNITGGLTNIYSLLRSQNIHIFRRKLEDKNISGVYIRHPHAGHCILINYVDDIYRQNFSTAHEYCHVLFDSESEQRISYDRTNDYIEVRANNFASNFLVPSSVFTELTQKVASYDFISTWIINKCKKYMVNKYVLIFRLSDLNIISETMKNNLLSDKKLNVVKTYKEDPELEMVSPNLIAPLQKLMRNGISLEYINLCRSAFNEGFITYSKMVNSLHLDFHEGKQVANMMDIILEV